MPKSETQRLYWCHLEIIQAKWHAVTEQYQRSTSGKLIFKPGRHEKMDSNLRQIIHALPRTTSFHCFQRNEREVFWGTVYSRTNKKNHHSLPTLPYGRDFPLLNKIRTKEFLKVTQFAEIPFLFMAISVLWHAAGKQHKCASGQLLHLTWNTMSLPSSRQISGSSHSLAA